MANQRFTDLPVVTPQLTDVICAVQGYVSPTVPGVSVQETLGSILSLAPPLGLGFVTVTTATYSLSQNNIYFINYSGGRCVLTLPETSNAGEAIYILGNSSGGWQINQLAGQQITISAAQTTLGVSGSISSLSGFDSIQLICTTANTFWQAPCGPQGCITIV